MTEHEKLKEICETIGYDKNWRIGEILYKGEKYNDIFRCYVDVREIIFTKIFRIFFIGFLYFIQSDIHFDTVMDHLDNPVDYLAKLIGLNK